MKVWKLSVWLLLFASFALHADGLGSDDHNIYLAITVSRDLSQEFSNENGWQITYVSAGGITCRHARRPSQSLPGQITNGVLGMDRVFENQYDCMRTPRRALNADIILRMMVDSQVASRNVRRGWTQMSMGDLSCTVRSDGQGHCDYHGERAQIAIPMS